MIRMLRGLPALVLGALLACGGAVSADKSAPRSALKSAERAAIQAPAELPAAAKETLAYIRAHHEAPPGFEGGRRFGNYERRLPERDAAGRRIAYQEWDIHPHQAHRSRGAERLITGSDGRAWFTADHYGHFIEAREAP
ncbi:MAG TPA: ribonuclease domain-containing protein [Holophagaceae bacterium]|nr:ribonuclease domain-containing protein [Holophagaceae bacterium]